MIWNVPEMKSTLLILVAFWQDGNLQQIQKPKHIDIVLDDHDVTKWLTQPDGKPWRGIIHVNKGVYYLVFD